MSFRDMVRRDARVKKLLGMLETPVYSLNIAKLEKEIVSIQKIRMFRSLEKAQVTKRFYETSIDVILENSRDRGRLAEIHLHVTIKKNKLKKHISSLKKYLSYTYGERLKRIATTAKDREAAIDSLIIEAIERLDDFNSLLENADFVIKDIESASWDAKEIVKVFEIQSERKMVRV